MTRRCQITGKLPAVGNTVSHAHNKRRRRFLPNLHVKRIWVPSQNRWIRLRLSSHGMRILDKIGVEAALELVRKRAAE